MSLPKVKKLTFRNGLRLLLIPKPGVATTALILVAAGSEYETRRTNGLSHFLEHMVFKGTKRHPKPGMTAEALDALGAEYNAFTSQEFTGYWAKAENSKLRELLGLVCDLYLHPLFEAKEIEKERGVIIEELNMYADTPMRKVQDLFLEARYGNQPAGWDVGGEKEIIRRLERRDFLNYRKARYVAPGTVIAVSGEFSGKTVKDMLAKEFGRLPRIKAPAKPRTKAGSRGPRILVKHKASDQSHLVLGVPTFSMFDKRRYAAEVMAHVLGGGMSSRLFMKLREEMGAAYYVRASSSLSLDHGDLTVSTGANNPKLKAVIGAVLGEFERLKRETIGPAELKKVKDHLVGTFLLGLETSDALGEYYAEQELMTGKMLSPAEIVKHIQAITADKIRGLARQIFRTKGLTMALIGPSKSESLRKLLRFSS